MNNEIWLRASLWQRLSGTSGFRFRLLDLLRARPGSSWAELRRCAVELGWELREPLQELPLDVIREAEKSVERSLRRGWHLLTPMDPLFPENLLRGMDPPLALSVAGSCEALRGPSLSVVGSREPTSDSLLWMEEHLSEFVRSTRTTIVSGGARGIDQKAHSVALRNGGATVAFLPSGLEEVYPRDFSNWMESILEKGGAVVSEYPSSLRMARQNFHQRNRLIAAQGTATLIVQAKPRSGTLLTATRAAEIGRPLWVVPAHPQNGNYGGNLQLLAEGASMVRQSEDLIYFWQAEQW